MSIDLSEAASGLRRCLGSGVVMNSPREKNLKQTPPKVEFAMILLHYLSSMTMEKIFDNLALQDFLFQQ